MIDDEEVIVTAAQVVADAMVNHLTLDSDDLVVGAVLIVKVRDARDQTGVYVATSPGDRLSWVDRLAMVTHVADVERSAAVERRFRVEQGE